MRVRGLEGIPPLAERSLTGEKAAGKGQERENNEVKEQRTAVDGHQGRHRQAGEQEIIDAIERANKSLEIINTRFEFSIHEGTKEIMVKVLDDVTGEIIREIPPEKILDLVAKMWEMAGLFVDEKA